MPFLWSMLILNAVKDELKLGKCLQGNTFTGVNLVSFRAGFRFQTIFLLLALCDVSGGHLRHSSGYNYKASSACWSSCCGSRLLTMTVSDSWDGCGFAVFSPSSALFCCVSLVFWFQEVCNSFWIEALAFWYSKGQPIRTSTGQTEDELKGCTKKQTKQKTDLNKVNPMSVLQRPRTCMFPILLKLILNTSPNYH